MARKNLTPESTDLAILEKLENQKVYSLEELSRELGVDKADVHRSFMRLCRRDGWSIRPYNRTPYWRGMDRRQPYPRQNRGRAKGERYYHDMAEPDWDRTLFEVRRPEKESE